jgi:glycosyltransferase involved in cell wall biosynthesis
LAELVSILIPAYNAEQWIEHTIKSAIGQTWREKEVIIVDDGSTDNTFNIAKTFASKEVKVITQENAGACAARNKALSSAQGDYIQWLDADDLLHPDKISLQLSDGEKGSISRNLLTCSWGKFFFRQTRAKFKPNSLWKDLQPVEWMINKFEDGVWMNPTVWLVSRRLTEFAGPWDSRSQPDDDGEYICRIVKASTGVKFVPKAKCYYRIGNTSSLSSIVSDDHLKSIFLSMQLQIEHLLAMENSSRTRHACVKLIQNTLPFFYQEKPELVAEASELANSLGGSLIPYKGTFKYQLVSKLLGKKNAKKIKITSYRAKLEALKMWDRFLA